MNGQRRWREKRQLQSAEGRLASDADLHLMRFLPLLPVPISPSPRLHSTVTRCPPPAQEIMTSTLSFTLGSDWRRIT